MRASGGIDEQDTSQPSGVQTTGRHCTRKLIVHLPAKQLSPVQIAISYQLCLCPRVVGVVLW